MMKYILLNAVIKVCVTCLSSLLLVDCNEEVLMDHSAYLTRASLQAWSWLHVFTRVSFEAWSWLQASRYGNFLIFICCKASCRIKKGIFMPESTWPVAVVKKLCQLVLPEWFFLVILVDVRFPSVQLQYLTSSLKIDSMETE